MVITLTQNLERSFKIPNSPNTFTQKKSLATTYKGDGIQKSMPDILPSFLVMTQELPVIREGSITMG